MWRREFFAALCCLILCASASQTQESVDALASRAAAAREAGKLEDALALYRKGVEARPEWDEGRWYVATLLYEMDRYAEARDAFAEVLRRQPAHAGALGLKGLCEFELRRYDRALADLLEAANLGVSRSPGIATVVRYHAAILLTRFGDFEVANQMLTEFAAEGADTPQVIEAFGINVLRLPMLPSELPADARERIGLAGRAGYAMAARQMEAARTALNELITRYPAIAHAHYSRGVFLLTEDADRALEDFRRELEISPSHVPARLQIAFEYLKRGEPAKARRPAEEAAQLAPEHFATRLAVGQVLLELNELDQALVELERHRRSRREARRPTSCSREPTPGPAAPPTPSANGRSSLDSIKWFALYVRGSLRWAAFLAQALDRTLDSRPQRWPAD